MLIELVHASFRLNIFTQNKLILIFILISFFKSYSQVYSFKNYTEDDGLSQSFIYDICQDNKGFLINLEEYVHQAGQTKEGLLQCYDFDL